LLTTQWHVIYEGGQGKERRERLAHSLGTVVTNAELKLIEARCCVPDSPIETIIDDLRTEPVLVVDNDDNSRLLGILTGFDIV
jgi:CBS domain-containing protein